MIFLKKKNLLIISTGGTIAGRSINSDSQESFRYKGTERFPEILETAKRQMNIARIEPIEVCDEDSSNICPFHWVKLIDVICKNYDEFDSFLITHGTNTMGYTSAALSFALGNLGKPVIITGAQVPFGKAGSDSVLNLENAIRVAVDERLAGVLVVFGSHIIIGARAKKTTEFDYDAFKSFNSVASLGRIGQQIRIDKASHSAFQQHLGTMARYANELDVYKNFNMNIASLTEFPGMSSEYLINQVECMKVEGIILRSSGTGDPNILPEGRNNEFGNLRDGFDYLRERRIPIIITTHAPDGIAKMDINEPGKLARDLGAVAAWDMSIESMTVKLGWLLGQELKYENIKSRMLESIRGEIVLGDRWLR